jgi:chaperonin cofactor prefoldin
MYWIIIFYFLDCNKKQESLQRKVEESTDEEKKILERQKALKVDLYGKFGDSINLEN